MPRSRPDPCRVPKAGRLGSDVAVIDRAPGRAANSSGRSRCRNSASTAVRELSGPVGYEIANLFRLGIGQLGMHRQAEDAPADGLSLGQSRFVRKDSPLICWLQVHGHRVVNQCSDAVGLEERSQVVSTIAPDDILMV